MKPVKPSPTPWTAHACQADQGETTVIVDALGYVVATINSPAWDDNATLEYPQDRANMKLIVTACNNTLAVRDEALEEAATLCDIESNAVSNKADKLAAQIRAIKSRPATAKLISLDVLADLIEYTAKYADSNNEPSGGECRKLIAKALAFLAPPHKKDAS